MIQLPLVVSAPHVIPKLTVVMELLVRFRLLRSNKGVSQIKIFSVLISLILITSCSSNDSAKTYNVPKSCEDTKVLAAFPDSIPNPKFIDTPWEPAEGTDLYAAMNGGGLACSYGIQEAEVGATILWAPNESNLFETRAKEWQGFGQQAIDLPNLDEDSAYVLTEGTQGQGEYHVWAINYLINGIWIQVNATFFGSIEAAMPIVTAATESLTVS